ncbi:MAG: hypothetical protein ABFS32_22355 [Bacteroidota bacterium]
MNRDSFDNWPQWTDIMVRDIYREILNYTNIKESLDVLPKEYILEQNYPNPFNPSTKISYSIPQQSYVTLKVFDVLGR